MDSEELYTRKRLAKISRRREDKRKKKTRRRICALVTVTAVGLSAMGAVYTVSAKEVTITEINEFTGVNVSRTVTTRADEVGELLDEQGIAVSSTDKLNKAAESELDGDDEVVVRRGKEIKVVTSAGEETVVVTSADTHAALKEAGYEPKDNDEINLDGGNIAGSATVEVKEVHTDYETVTEELPFETVYEDDGTMYVGEESVATEGAAGVKTIVYKVERYADGTERSRSVESESVDAEPVNKVIKRGTAAKPTEAPKKAASAAADTAVTDTGGTINGMSYSKKITVNATAYTPSPAENGGSTLTAMGTPVRHGAIAVDPSVIPLGTRVYVVSNDGQYVYGTAVAEDTGGAIKGNRIDLCYETSAEANAFGRRSCTVYILD